MGAITGLTDVTDWEVVWERLADDDASPVLVFKASPYCGVSRRAEAEFTRFAESLAPGAGVSLCRVDVVNARDVAQRIAADTGVTHESPQALLITAGWTVAWSAIHYSIKESALSEALAALNRRSAVEA